MLPFFVPELLLLLNREIDSRLHHISNLRNGDQQLDRMVYCPIVAVAVTV